ncbi:hypothetical protein JTE90_005979 [Oedothorax gibbosus]|uniref:Uncharacterized protein n=1 Tax=Oedothorax gibbosus TaxID=931172 RepID=A0AAV6UZC8_9ARAC|nr:hypothetical protein JTE90_005979 [Oedothorax gibbosus]
MKLLTYFNYKYTPENVVLNTSNNKKKARFSRSSCSTLDDSTYSSTSEGEDDAETTTTPRADDEVDPDTLLGTWLGQLQQLERVRTHLLSPLSSHFGASLWAPALQMGNPFILKSFPFIVMWRR